NGKKVTYDGDAENLRLKTWQMWYIDLASLGVNLSNITTLTIGFERIGTIGGQGMILLDGIRLYSYDRQLVTPVDPSTAGLQAQYQFEGNTNDSSGKGRNGTIQGGPLFVAGQVGQAISLDGIDDCVSIAGYKGILADAAGVQHAFTLSAWIKTTINGTIIAWGTNAGGQRMDFRVDTVLRVEHGSGNIRGTNGPSLLDDQWHHVAATVPDAGRIMDVRLYVDGADVTAASTTTAAFNLTADADVVIGMAGPYGGRFFTGQIDETRMYDRALSPEEITWLAGRTMPFDKPL
ncbi:MAG TPA: LamG domain-containing protein, partial [Sedimentisphaerales bacterium]|nr:LamG domain-containing protein [Sedimentisphaerales bacterium]